MKLRSILPPLCVVLSAQIMHLRAQEYVAEYEAREWLANAEEDVGARTKALQKMMRSAGYDAQYGDVRVHFGAGTYMISDYLPLFSNITLELDDDATIVSDNSQIAPGMLRGLHFSEENIECPIDEFCTHGGHTQITNVTIRGGVWNRASAASDDTYILRAVHGADIAISNVVFRGATDHFLNLSGGTNITIANVTFENAVKYTGYDEKFWGKFERGDEARYTTIEAVHLDYCSEEGEPNAFPLDDTPCSGVSISGCLFSNVLAGVGTHHNPVGDRAADLTIRNCAFSNNLSYACYVFGFDNVTIEGNSICKGEGLLYSSRSASFVAHNHVAENEMVGTDAPNAVYLYDNSSSRCEENVFQDCISTVFRVNEKSSLSASNNNIYRPGKHGFSATEGSILKATGNLIEDAGENGIYLHGADTSGEVEYNTVIKPLAAGIRADANAEVIAQSNEIKFPQTYGISIGEQTKYTLKSNTIASPAANGIRVESAAADGTITKNKIEQAGERGIYVISTDSATIEANTIMSATGHGISVSGGSVTIKKNAIDKTGNAANGIYLTACKANATSNNIINAGAAGIRADANAEVIAQSNEIKFPQTYGISIGEQTKYTLKSNTIASPAANGIRVESAAADGTITKNKIEQAGERGIYVISTDSATIEANTIMSATGHGISVSGGSVTIKKNAIDKTGNAANGIYLTACKAGVVGNKILGVGAAGIRADEKCKLTAKDNVITSPGTHGLSVAGMSSYSISGNTIKAAGQAGVFVNACAASGTVSGNKISNTQQSGIVIKESEKSTVSDNTIVTTGKATEGIFVRDAAKATILRNTVSKAGGHGIRVQGTAKKKITATISGNISSTANSDYADIRIGDYCANCSVTGNLTPSAKGVTISKTGTSGTKVTAAKFSVKLMRYTSAKDTESKVYKIEFGVGKALDKVATLKWSKKGYTFKGWASAKDGKVVYSDGQTIKSLASKPDETVTLYAVWSPIKYNVSFDANGGTGKMSTVKNREYGSKKALSGNQFKRENYAFTGWATAKGGSKKYGDKTTADLTTKNGATVKLYACWKLKTFSVAFDANGGKGTLPKGFSINSGATKKIGEQKLTWTGYTFAGWTLDKSGKGAVYKDKGELKGLTGNDGDKFTLYAKWSPVKYAVAYNANGGKGSIGNTSLTYNKEAKLAANTFTKSGYTFLGWAKSAERAKAYTVDYTDQKDVKNLSSKKGATVTLYAVWGENYTVKFFRNVSSSDKTAATQAMCVGKAAALKKFADLKWSKTGYTFKGWAKSVADASAGKVSYTDAKTVKNLTTKKGATVSLYAVWSANSYTVKFMRNVSSTDTFAASQAMTVDREAALKKFAELKWSKTGYTFKGWAKSAADASAGKVAYADAKTVKNLTTKKGATVLLYAVWSANSYTVKFMRNVSSTDTFGASQTMIVDKEATLRKFVDLKWSNTGYIFKGWATSVADASAGKVSYTDAQTVKNLAMNQGATVLLYAVWVPVEYNVAFDANGGDGTMEPVTSRTWGDAQALPANVFTRDGYTFGGWALAPDGEKAFDDQSRDNITSQDGVTVTLYAVWNINTYTVVFDSQGGSDVASAKRTYGAKIGELPVPEKEGYKFLGWFTAQENGEEISEETKVTGDATYYAQWESLVPEIDYDSLSSVEGWEELPDWAMGFFTCSNDNYEVYIEIAEFGFCSTVDLGVYYKYYEAAIEETLPLIVPVTEALLQRLGLEPEDIDQIGKTAYLFRNVTHEYCNIHDADDTKEPVVFDVFVYEDFTIDGKGHVVSDKTVVSAEFEIDAVPEEEEEPEPEPVEELPNWAKGEFLCSGNEYMVRITIDKSLAYLSQVYSYDEDGNEIVIYNATKTTPPVAVKVTDDILLKFGLDSDYAEDVGETAYLYKAVVYEATVVEGDEEGDETGTVRNPITLNMYIYHDLANDGMGRIVCDMTAEDIPLYISALQVEKGTTEDPDPSVDPENPEEPEPVEELPDWAKGDFVSVGNDYVVEITIDEALEYLSKIYSTEGDLIYEAKGTTPPVAVKVTDDILPKLGVDSDYAEWIGGTAYLYKAVVYEATVVEGDEDGDETVQEAITVDVYIHSNLTIDGELGHIVCDMTVEEPSLYIDAWPVVSVTTEDPEGLDDPELDNSGDPD